MIATLPDNFWSVTAGNLSTMVVVFGAFIGVLWRISSWVTRLEEVTGDAASLTKKVSMMDHEGTMASRMALKMETELTVSNTKQIQSLTDQMLKITPNIAVIKTDLEWIKNGIRTGSIVRSRETHIPKPEKLS